MEQAVSVERSLLPAKSIDRYEHAYHQLETWKGEHSVPSDQFSETLFLGYFSHLSEHYASSTLWSIYSMLHRIVSVKTGVDIKSYARLHLFLKVKNTGHQAKKSARLHDKTLSGFCVMLMTKIGCTSRWQPAFLYMALV